MTIDEDFKQAMLDKNEIAVSAIRNLKAEIKNTEIEKKRPLSESEVQDLVKRKVKQHKDSIESFRAGGREDLTNREQQQMEVLLKYLPKQMEEAEVRALVKEVITELSAQASDFGKVMKEVLARAKGTTDGSVVSKIVKEELK
ncbi:MAG: GatB/YqeY domain-containing protein [Candidatus Doudnabacteria bacterium]|nr:GatB/YqeY domain-containing protein [Candidatus Doudnabacteria bacterium]